MQSQFDAVYEDGVLKPLSKLNLPEHVMVHVLVTSAEANQCRPLQDWPRSVPADLELADPTIDRADVLAATARIPDSVVDELRREREGRHQMPAHYFETSAILKLYKPEVGSAKVESIQRAAAAKPFVSKLAIIEVISVFNRFVRKGLLSQADYGRFEGRFLADLQAGAFDILVVDDRHFTAAERLLRKHGQQRECQAPDALHLAVAI